MLTRFFLIVLLIPGVNPSALAEEESAAEKAGAGPLLNRFADFYRGLDGATAEYTSTVRLKAASLNVESTHKLAMLRPNKLSIVTTSGLSGGEVISDGEHLYMAIGAMKRYTIGAAPSSFDAWMDQHRSGRTPIPAPGIELVMQLLTSEPAARLLGEPEKAKIGEPEPIGDVICRRVAGETDAYSIALWIEEGENPWLRRMEVRSSASDDRDQVEMDFAFSTWAAETPADERFAIAPPADFTRVETLYPERRRGEAAQPKRAAAPPRDSKSGGRTLAPDFDLPLLDGGTLDLSKHIGKDVVVLDFWATWCRPCVMALPVVSEAAQALKDRGVAFYAVNLREPQPKVAGFIQARRWTFPVALDATGKIGRMYSVSSIPHTVVIDRNGRIAHTHVGFSPQIGRQLQAEIEALLNSGG